MARKSHLHEAVGRLERGREREGVEVAREASWSTGGEWSWLEGTEAATFCLLVTSLGKSRSRGPLTSLQSNRSQQSDNDVC